MQGSRVELKWVEASVSGRQEGRGWRGDCDSPGLPVTLMSFKAKLFSEWQGAGAGIETQGF